MATAVRNVEAPTDRTSLPLIQRPRPVVELSDDQLLALSSLNRDLRIERNAEGELLLMPPAGGATGGRNAEITRQVGNWAKTDGTSTAFDSSTGFRLPNGAVRSPDAAWVLRPRLEAISPEEREKFLPLCPDFVIELRSFSDTLRDVQAKMEEYLTNGARLGWLIDPYSKHLYVYRPGAAVETLENPKRVFGDPLLPGFVLDLREVW